jgi:uncharacterized phage protein gp47/JayE
MYEEYSFEKLLQEKLNMIDDSFDKRQGSVIYDTLSPNAAESAKLYIAMEMLMNRTFADTAVGEDLDRRVAERNIVRNEAIKTHIKANFYDADMNLFDISLGDRFLCGNNIFVAINRFEKGIFELECEIAGEDGNNVSQNIIASEYIEGLGYGTFDSILIYGEEAEDDESLRARYLDSFNNLAFGGNIYDYKKYIKQIESVGGAKIYPAYFGGGTVRIVITNNGYTVPEDEIVKEVQDKIDPVPKGSGLGMAPIGHDVTVEACGSDSINISTKITYNDGYSSDNMESIIKENIENYIQSLREHWDENDNIIIRISYIEMGLLELEGILDVENTTINGEASNYYVDTDSIPILGTVELT